MRTRILLSLGALAVALIALAQAPDLGAIRRKVAAGETLAPEERQTLQKANAAAQKKRREEYLKDHTPVASTGNVALTDLGTGLYKSEQGGLYPGSTNTIPAAHLAAGVKLARQIKPLDLEGNPSADGKIVLLAIGFSNPNMEFPAFQKLAAAEPGLNPKLLLVNGCVGGRESKVIANPESNYWNEARQLISKAGTTPKQIQVVWIKMVVANPTQPFPVEAKQLAGDYVSTLQNVHKFFPNAKLAFLSNRTYGGYTEANGSPEPWAYESGFGVKWAVATQLEAKPEANYDPAKGEVRAVWAEWGPYLWTDGEKGRKDGFVYLRSDVGIDGLHPSASGQQKIGHMLLSFFQSDPATKPWFVK
jgi:lysophospholipase L1-like esterase